MKFFAELIPTAHLLALPSLQQAQFYERIFCPLITLWYVVFQRLNSDHTLDAVLADATSGGADCLRPISALIESSATTSYSDARKRWPLAFFWEAFHLQIANIRAKLPLIPGGLKRSTVLLDGSTIRLRPYKDIREHYPPTWNNHGESDWSLMRVVVAFCACSGAIVATALGATKLSEQALALQIFLKTKSPTLFVGDRNFGIFRVVHAAVQSGHDVLFRLTEVRARCLLGKSLRGGDYQVCWKPTRGIDGQAIWGRLIVVKVRDNQGQWQWLYLFTTLPKTPENSVDELLRIYRLRWHVELNLRYLKTQMDLEQLECKSAEMAQKEWIAGLMGYNLIRAAQMCAAITADIPVIKLSFSCAQRRVSKWLENLDRPPAQILQRWIKLLEQIAKCRLPRRKKPRPSEPRAKRHIRSSYPPLRGSRDAARRNLKYKS